MVGVVEQRSVGATDIQLSVVGLGGAWLGHDPSDPSEVSRAVGVLRAACQAGVNWVGSLRATGRVATRARA